MDCSLPGSSVHGILQARILEWVSIIFSKESSQPRDWTQVSHIAGGFFTTREALVPGNGVILETKTCVLGVLIATAVFAVVF